MKTIWIAVGLLGLVIAGSFTLHFYSTAIYNDLQETLEQVCRAVEREDWEGARDQSGRLAELWSRVDAAWTPTMDHRQVDRLDESLTRVFLLLEQRRRNELLVEIAVARRIARRIKDTEVPNLRNVF
jgi:hypothetical protein